jgi:hypothetical protein
VGPSTSRAKQPSGARQEIKTGELGEELWIWEMCIEYTAHKPQTQTKAPRWLKR